MNRYAFAWDWGKSEPGNDGMIDETDVREEEECHVLESYRENMELMWDYRENDPESWNLMIECYHAWVEELIDGEYRKVWEPEKEDLEDMGWKKVRKYEFRFWPTEDRTNFIDRIIMADGWEEAYDRAIKILEDEHYDALFLNHDLYDDENEF